MTLGPSLRPPGCHYLTRGFAPPPLGGFAFSGTGLSRFALSPREATDVPSLRWILFRKNSELHDRTRGRHGKRLIGDVASVSRSTVGNADRVRRGALPPHIPNPDRSAPTRRVTETAGHLQALALTVQRMS